MPHIKLEDIIGEMIAADIHRARAIPFSLEALFCCLFGCYPDVKNGDDVGRRDFQDYSFAIRRSLQLRRFLFPLPDLGTIQQPYTENGWPLVAPSRQFAEARTAFQYLSRMFLERQLAGLSAGDS